MEIRSITSGRWLCLAVSPSPDRILIVGGYGAANSVEECVAVYFFCITHTTILLSLCKLFSSLSKIMRKLTMCRLNQIGNYFIMTSSSNTSLWSDSSIFGRPEMYHTISMT